MYMMARDDQQMLNKGNNCINNNIYGHSTNILNTKKKTNLNGPLSIYTNMILS